MAQSLNKVIDLQTTGTSYLSISGKVGKFLVGDQALEFYPDVNVEQYIQIPWSSIQQIGANIIKIAREKLGNDKVVKLPTLIQTIGQKFKNLFAKK